MAPPDNSPELLSAAESVDSRAAPQDPPEDRRSFLSELLVALPFAVVGIGVELQRYIA